MENCRHKVICTFIVQLLPPKNISATTLKRFMLSHSFHIVGLHSEIMATELQSLDELKPHSFSVTKRDAELRYYT